MVPRMPPRADKDNTVEVLLAAIKVTVEKLDRDFDKHETECEKRGDVLTEVVRRLDAVEKDASGTVKDVEIAHHRLEAFNLRLAAMDLADAKRTGFALGSVKTVTTLLAILSGFVTLTYGAISAIHTLTGGP